jgi:endonuclease YncB( thermonuclease family)
MFMRMKKGKSRAHTHKYRNFKGAYLGRIVGAILAGVILSVFASLIDFFENNTPSTTNLKSNQSYQVRVTRVIDGDSFEIKIREENTSQVVRIYGIDAPEFGQPIYNTARSKLNKILKDKDVVIEILGVDDYQRFVAKVFINEGQNRQTDVAAKMLKRGMAWAIRGKDRGLTQYLTFEKTARDNKTGIWKEEASPTPPWAYRASKKNGAKKAPQ